ncbi:MAG: CRISPR-associated endonuclease Cas2 [Anaerolinea sp.]|nr:CRISPR-associated endonuclease Cas2 [Anaerolinea sp.]
MTRYSDTSEEFMHLLLLFDVTSDRIRRKMSEICIDYGMDRTQFSAFVGDLTRSQQRELMQRLRDLLGDEAGALLLVPVSYAEWEQRQEYRNDAPGDGKSTFPSTIADRDNDKPTLY